MNYCERIPAKTQTVTLDGKNVKIDTEGLEATVAAADGTVYIKAAEECADTDAFALEKGERISYVDETIVSSKAETAYSVLPRHAALYEMGRLVVGEESEAVSPQKNRKQSLLMEWFKN